MISELSGATIVIFIALGALVLVLLFIFAKRQIMRFTLRGPHVPVGHGTPRWLRKEIDRKLDLVGRVKYEPRLIPDEGLVEPVTPETLCRMQAMDDIKVLELQLKAADSKAIKLPGENIRTFLIAQSAGILKGCQPKTIHQLCDLYDRARFSPDGFNSQHLENYRELLANLVQISQTNKNNHINLSPKVGSKHRKKKEHQESAL